MKIAITGGLGFVGSNIAKRLAPEHETTIIDDLSFGSLDNITKNCAIQMARFQDVDFEDYDILIHCATSNIIYAQDHPIETFKNNAIDTIELFERFKGYIIYTSTASVYGQQKSLPTKECAELYFSNAYDVSKYVAEIYLRMRGNYTTLRLSNVYGSGQLPSNPYCGVIGRFIDDVINQRELTIYNTGMQTRDFTYIDDVVDAIELCLETNFDAEINISGGEEISVEQLSTYIHMILDEPIRARYIEGRSIDGITRRWLDCHNAEMLLGWKPKTRLKQGLKKTINESKAL